ncbi:MAG TPA: glycosyltransferase family A protein [Thermoanaerobaculia bacterium]|nr:glycosyltransferase family A protein [Thermoanaerobaculia bacterium]
MTVLLPVRDEEKNVLLCLDSLLAQTARPLVRVVDDGSSDATAELVRRRMAEQDNPGRRLVLVEAGPLPAGWRGKLHALHAGLGSPGADGPIGTPWLLLTDADTRHHPELLARARTVASARRLDALSLAGAQEVVGLGENLLAPAVFALLDVFLGDWEAAAEGGPAVANGQFILLSRSAWEACGGFASVRGETIDDVAIVARLRAAGYRTGFFRAPDLLRVRMYRGFRAAVSGWRRNLGGLFGPRPLAAGGVLAALLLPPLALAAALLAGQLVGAALLWTAGAASSMIFRSGSRHAPIYGFLYPLDTLLLAAVLARGMADHRRGRLASWKGREMRV